MGGGDSQPGGLGGGGLEGGGGLDGLFDGGGGVSVAKGRLSACPNSLLPPSSLLTESMSFIVAAAVIAVLEFNLGKL